MVLWMVGLGAVSAFGMVWVALRSRNLERWIWSYVRTAGRSRPVVEGPIHLFLCVADHFEPAWAGAPTDVQRARVDVWAGEYRQFAARHRDASGRPHQHTFFYPGEVYDPEHLERLAGICRDGYGDVEIHLHHHNDTEQGVRTALEEFADALETRHGLLRPDPETGRRTYGFIHGNWALDNSGPHGQWCGVNNELTVLRETGCYADFTLPSAPSVSQTSTINSIYYATDDPHRPKSHDVGTLVEVDRPPSGDLMIIQGPLTLNWASRKWGVFPRIENGDLSRDAPPTRDRVDMWVRQHIHVRGRPEWVFVKLHTHGAQEDNVAPLLGPAMDDALSYLETAYNDGERYVLHYVTAWEMYQVIKAAERGVERVEDLPLHFAGRAS